MMGEKRLALDLIFRCCPGANPDTGLNAKTPGQSEPACWAISKPRQRKRLRLSPTSSDARILSSRACGHTRLGAFCQTESSLLAQSVTLGIAKALRLR